MISHVHVHVEYIIRASSRSSQRVGCRMCAEDHHFSMFSATKCQWTWVRVCNIISSPRARRMIMMFTSRYRLLERRHWQGSPDERVRADNCDFLIDTSLATRAR